MTPGSLSCEPQQRFLTDSSQGENRFATGGRTTLGPVTSTAARGRDRLTRADGSPIRALVVDDEPSLGELLSTVLR
jgi:hypothetical protein